MYLDFRAKLSNDIFVAYKTSNFNGQLFKI